MLQNYINSGNRKFRIKERELHTCSAFIADQNPVFQNTSNWVTVKTQKLILKEQSFHPEFSEEQRKHPQIYFCIFQPKLVNQFIPPQKKVTKKKKKEYEKI